MALKVLHVVGALDLRAGDVAWSVVDFARALGGRGGRQVLMGRGGDGLDVETVGASELGEVLGDVDVVHVHGVEDLDESFRVVMAAKEAGVGVVLSPLGVLGAVDVSGLGWFARRKLKGIKRLVETATVVTGLNGFEVGQLQALGAEHVEPLAYGVDVSRYSALGGDVDGVGVDEKVLLYLGRIEPEGGVVVLMRALAGLGPAFDGWRLLVVGDDGGDWVQQLRAGVTRKGAADRVIFVTAGDMDVQMAWLGRADAVVCPNMTVRCPVVVGQAVAAGKPVLSTEMGLCDGDVAGVRRCAAEQGAIGRGLAGLLGDVGGTVSAAGTVFDVSVMAERCLGIYERCISGPRVL